MNLSSASIQTNHQIAPAKTRKGTKPGIHKEHDRAQRAMIAAVVQKSKPVHQTKAAPEHVAKNRNKRRHQSPISPEIVALATVAPAKTAAVAKKPSERLLPEALLDPFGEIRLAIDALEEPMLVGKLAKAGMTNAVEAIRSEILSHCAMYQPVPVGNIPVSGKHVAGLPALADGHGLMCASGTDGYAVFRGQLCTKKCSVGDTVHDRHFVPLTSIASANQLPA